jgi:AcrR family transcriptional regulator
VSYASSARDQREHESSVSRFDGRVRADSAQPASIPWETITWAPYDDDDEGRRSLNRALLALADGRLDDAIVPANVAVEVTLNRVLSEHLGRVGIGRERLRDFMSNAATYSHQLNILLPVVLAGRGAPAMPEHIRGPLNRLRDLRNDIGHRGLSRTPLTREVVGECLAGAAFGFHFVRLADEVLAGTPPK